MSASSIEGRVKTKMAKPSEYAAALDTVAHYLSEAGLEVASVAQEMLFDHLDELDKKYVWLEDVLFDHQATILKVKLDIDRIMAMLRDKKTSG